VHFQHFLFSITIYFESNRIYPLCSATSAPIIYYNYPATPTIALPASVPSRFTCISSKSITASSGFFRSLSADLTDRSGFSSTPPPFA
jgi:hypothetical protein